MNADEEDYEVIPTIEAGVQILISNHRHPLILDMSLHKPGDKVLTVELYSKWYSLYLVEQVWVVGTDNPGEYEFKVTAIHYGNMEADSIDLEVPYCADHVPNPQCVRAFCERKGYIFQELAEELIVGRWELEYKGNHG